jgi:hypothetical protein
MSTAGDFRAALALGDLAYLRGIWRVVAPHLPQPESDADAEVVMHRARTEAATLPLNARAWSHRWLEERGLPSGLPDELRPKAERLRPPVVEGVGISVNCHSDHLRPAAIEVRKAMEIAVEEAFADGRTDPGFLTARMNEARRRAWKQLLG